MSGFEALSMVCSIMQVISFTKEVLTLCKDVYEGRETNDSRMEENLTSLKVSLEEMNRYSSSTPQRTKYEKELNKMAQKCSKVAKELQKEIQRITKYYESGDCMKSIIAIYMSKTRKRKIEALYDQFCQYQKMLETQILVHLCTKSDAIALQQRENFTELSDTMKYFISQLAAGHTDTANLIAHDGVQTRQYIQQSEARMKQSMKIFQDEANKESKRDRLLRGLKYESMNSRRTELKLAHEATYVSIFESLDIDEESHTAPTSSSAEAWRKFVQWLQSDRRVFWIHGKPGAGKSTLMKFLLQHKNTQRGVDKWSPNTLIVSHFFWKPGNILQKNLRGLLCSLTHQLLSSDHNLIDHTLSRFLFATDKDTIGDWEIAELESVFHSILIHCKRSIFFLIDGLDEATETGEIFQFLDSFIGMNNIKICLSSRGEAVFLQKFSKYDGFKLNELTENDMLQFVLVGIPETDGYPSDFLDGLRRLLVQKAEGVYLWLVMALESVKRGLRNSDEQDEIYLRLSKLPSKLEELYADMWDRLGEDRHIYQKEAVRYFSILIMNQSLLEQYNKIHNSRGGMRFNWDLNSLHLMLTTNEKVKKNMLDKSCSLSPSEISKSCADTVKSMSIKTAGFLAITQSKDFYEFRHFRCRGEFEPLSKYLLGKVNFIHRTLFDFFKESEVGKAILAKSQQHRTDVELGTIILCQLRTMEPPRFRSKGKMALTPNLPLHYFRWILFHLAAEDSALKNKEIMNLIYAASDLFEAGLLPWDYRPKWYPYPSFDLLLMSNPVFKGYIQSNVKEKGGTHATCLLREFMSSQVFIFEDTQYTFDRQDLILSLGGDINSLGICLCELLSTKSPGVGLNMNTIVGFTRYESILSLVIKKIHMDAFFTGKTDHEFMQYIVAALELEPSLNQHTSIAVKLHRAELYSHRNECRMIEVVNLLAKVVSTRNSLHDATDIRRNKTYIIMEVNLKYLIEQFFEFLRSHAEDKEKHLINCARQLNKMDSCKPFVKALFFIQREKSDSTTFYRFNNQNHDIFADIIIDTSSLISRRTIPTTIVDNYLKECEKVDASALSALLGEKLGVCYLEDMGIKLPGSRSHIWNFDNYQRFEEKEHGRP
ncbi:hypothetical protein J3E69DRAFT_181937 [Trichoderma sp. SZMC 28015]